MSQNSKHLLSHISCGSGIWELSASGSGLLMRLKSYRRIDHGCSHAKPWLVLEDPLPRWLIPVAFGRRSQFLPQGAFPMTWQQISSRANERKSKEETSMTFMTFYDLFSEVIRFSWNLKSLPIPWSLWCNAVTTQSWAAAGPWMHLITVPHPLHPLMLPSEKLSWTALFYVLPDMWPQPYTSF